MNSPYRLQALGGRTLRVGRWNWPGSAGAVPLLVFNGLGINMEVMEALACALAPRPVVMFDMPGVGGSPDPILPYTAWMAARWGAGLLKRESIPQADILGFSWGGAIAQQFAIQHPAKVNKLVLAGIGPGFPFVTGEPTALALLTNPTQLGELADGERLIGMSLPDRTALTPAFRDRLRKPGKRGYLYQWLALAGWASTPFLPLLRKPTLVVMGDKDPIVPLANGHLLSALIANSRLETMRGAGHLFMFSHHDRFVALLQEFLGESSQAAENRAA